MLSTATGIAYHHFWGTYSADVYLTFNTKWQATEARKALPFADKWKQQNKCIGIHITDEDGELDKVVEHLVTLGAEREKILSVAKSVDSGEKFTITMELEHPDRS